VGFSIDGFFSGEPGVGGSLRTLPADGRSDKPGASLGIPLAVESFRRRGVGALLVVTWSDFCGVVGCLVTFNGRGNARCGEFSRLAGDVPLWVACESIGVDGLGAGIMDCLTGDGVRGDSLSLLVSIPSPVGVLGDIKVGVLPADVCSERISETELRRFLRGGPATGFSPMVLRANGDGC
jgi:hypothetical protein